MKEDRMYWIHNVLVHLEPVAGIVQAVGDELVAVEFEAIVDGELRPLLRRPEVTEHEPLVLPGRIGAVTTSACADQSQAGCRAFPESSRRLRTTSRGSSNGSRSPRGARTPASYLDASSADQECRLGHRLCGTRRDLHRRYERATAAPSPGNDMAMGCQ